LYQLFKRGDLPAARAVQFKLLELIKTMFAAGNFPEGFRAGVSLRGFEVGRTRQPMAEREFQHLEEIRSQLACLLADCGYSEAAAHCRRGTCDAARHSELRQIVRGVIETYKRQGG
ncbi:MAG: 4-hydroxy-tetrahydrodipicolinate synthase, partial [Verrucomicrobiota bacterium]